MKCIETLVVTAVLLVSGAIARAETTTWNYAADYSTTSNSGANGWQSGYLTDVGSTLGVFNAYDVFGSAADIPSWHTGSGTDPMGNANINPSSSPSAHTDWGIYWAGKQACLMPGTAGNWIAVRWTAPSAGNYNVSALWTNQRYDGCDTTVAIRNTATGIDMLSGSVATLTEFVGTDSSVAAGKATYNNTLYFTAGQNIDFIVKTTSSQASPIYQMVGLDATITAVPEPAAITLAVTGLIGLVAYAWRKRR